MLLEFVSFVLAVAFRAALPALWDLVCKAGQQRALAGCPVRAAKRAAQLSRPSWVVLPCRRLVAAQALQFFCSAAVDILCCVSEPW